MIQWIGTNTELVFRVGLFSFLFGVILMLMDKDFEKRFENNSFIRKAFALKISNRFNIKTEPYGTILSVIGAIIAFMALGLTGAST